MEWLVGPVDESSDRLYEFDRRDGLVVRVVVDNAGAAWFVAVDVFEALNVRNTRRALSDLDSDLLSSATIGGADRRLLAEPAVYVIAAQFPRNAIASSFRRWVHGVVMPAVRAKTTLP